MTQKTEKYDIVKSTNTGVVLVLVNSLLEQGWKTRSEMVFHDGFFIQAMYKPAPKQFYFNGNKPVEFNSIIPYLERGDNNIDATSTL